MNNTDKKKLPSNKELDQFREQCGYLPDDDLLDFARDVLVHFANFEK
jgi:hypothetical protein